MPNELGKLIHDFARPSHKFRHGVKFKNVTEKIPVVWALYKVNIVDHAFNSFDGILPFTSLVDTMVEDPAFLAKTLSKCNCCVRHQTNHPFAPETPITPTRRARDCDCACACRHTMRSLHDSYMSVKLETNPDLYSNYRN